MGGTKQPWVNKAANLLLLCRACHAHFESHRLAGLRLGVLLQAGQYATETPVNGWRGWVWLDNNGGLVACEAGGLVEAR